MASGEGTQASVTQDELKDLLKIMSKACDAVRLVEPSTFEARNYDAASGELLESYRCHSALAKGRRCDNCISARSVATKGSSSKFEFVGPDAYYINSRYIEVDGQPRAVEMISKVSDQIGSSEGLANLAVSVTDATEKAVVDQVTDAYNRSYYEDGIKSLDADKVALIRVANYEQINAQQGARVANRLMRAVAAAIRRHVRAIDTLIRYEDDVFFLQFESLPSHLLEQRLKELCEEGEAISLEGQEGVTAELRIGAVEREGTVEELAGFAEVALDRASADDPVCIDVFAQTARQPERTEIRRAEGAERLSYSIFFPQSDKLTGVMSQPRFIALLESEVEQASGTADNEVVVFDIEGFKAINRNIGFSEGDVLLKHVAHELEEEFPGRPLTRISADRFALLVPRKGLKESVKRLHERMRHYREGMPVEIKAGVCALSDDVGNVNILIDHAKTACDSIKGLYDHRMRRYDEDFDRQMSLSRHVLLSLDEALEKGYVKVCYMPIVRAASGAICSLEALSRWDDPIYGKLPSAEFVDTLERAHLINKLDFHVLEQVCIDLRSRIDAGEPVVPVSVNLAPVDFSLADVPKVVVQTCARHGIPHDLIGIEVTESSLAGKDVKDAVTQLDAMGIEVWMDDFGSGYSSLNMLKDYGFDVVKVDMAFLAGFDENQRAREIVVRVIDMAKRLGSRTLVEGVESEEEYLFLHRMGCEMMQGYLFGRARLMGEGFEKSLAIEPADERAYYDTVGRVNLAGSVLGASCDDLDMAAEFQPSEVPLAIVERRADRMDYLTANYGFIEAVGDELLELTGPFDRSRGYNDTDALLDLLGRELEAGESFAEERVVDVAYPGGQSAFYVQRIAVCATAEAFVVTPA